MTDHKVQTPLEALDQASKTLTSMTKADHVQQAEAVIDVVDTIADGPLRGRLCSHSIGTFKRDLQELRQFHRMGAGFPVYGRQQAKCEAFLNDLRDSLSSSTGTTEL